MWKYKFSFLRLLLWQPPGQPDSQTCSYAHDYDWNYEVANIYILGRIATPARWPIATDILTSIVCLCVSAFCTGCTLKHTAGSSVSHVFTQYW